MIATGFAGSAFLSRSLSAANAPDFEPEESSRARRIERIGLQLYTVRRALGADIEGTIAAVAAAGVKELEFAGYYNKPAEWWKALLAKHSLTAPSTHIGFPAKNEGWAPQFEIAQTLGHHWIIVPYLDAAMRKDADSWKRVAARLNESGELAKKAGIRMGYHNHDFEFAPIAGSDRNGFELLMDNTDPSLVDFELDIYWAYKAGADPMSLMQRYAKRITCCHVKDSGPAPEKKMLDVGAGVIDFRSILAKGRSSGLQHWFIEHDEPTDALGSVRASASAMKSM
jgi:sugar phosphate isomerase/epimerase